MLINVHFPLYYVAPSVKGVGYFLAAAIYWSCWRILKKGEFWSSGPQHCVCPSVLPPPYKCSLIPGYGLTPLSALTSNVTRPHQLLLQAKGKSISRQCYLLVNTFSATRPDNLIYEEGIGTQGNKVQKVSKWDLSSRQDLKGNLVSGKNMHQLTGHNTGLIKHPKMLYGMWILGVKSFFFRYQLNCI